MTNQGAAQRFAGPHHFNQGPDCLAMFALRIQFDRCLNPQAALEAVRLKEDTPDLRLQDDLLLIATERNRIFRFGRHWGCDVFLLDADTFVRGVGKEHFQIEITSQRCFARDLSTKNGTLINGKWLGGPPGQRLPVGGRVPSGRKELKLGDIIRLPGITLTVVEAPENRPTPASSESLQSPPDNQAASGPTAARLLPMVACKPAKSPGAPPVLEGFRFAATLGGKPATGLTYLYERTTGIGTTPERWVVRYFSFPSSTSPDELRRFLAPCLGIRNAALVQPHAYSLLPEAVPSALVLCLPFLAGADLAGAPKLDLAQVYDVMSAALAVLADLQEHGLAHGHICANNIFLEADGQIMLTDCGLNHLRSRLGAELTGPAPSPTNDLIALGDLWCKLLSENNFNRQSSTAGKAAGSKPVWPGQALQELAARLQQGEDITARQALRELQATQRPKVNRLLTISR